MGVRFLETFMKNHVPNGMQDINILQEIRNCGRANPLIVIDVLTLINVMADSAYDSIFAGRFQYAIAKANTFCDSLIQAGAKLVFFIDAHVQLEKYDTWLIRQDKSYDESMKTMDQIKRRQKTRYHVHGNVTKHPFTTALILVARQKGEMYHSHDNECDFEVARYATKNDALAVMTNDSDFLIFEGNWRVWSTSYLKLQNMSTVEFNKKDLPVVLNLPVNRLPYFATIAGNDSVKYELVQNFHHKLSNGSNNLWDKMKTIAEYVENLVIDHEGNVNENVITEIFSVYKEEYHEAFEMGSKMYNLNKPDAQKQIQDEIKHYPGRTVNILKNYPDSIRLPFLDLRIQPFQMPLYDMYKKQCGIVLQHKQDNKAHGLLIMKRSHKSQHENCIVNPIYPSIVVPPLRKLYSADKQESVRLYDIKYELFRWLISNPLIDRIAPNQFAKIDSEYFIDILTLCYLVALKFITVEEADIILISINHVLSGIVPRRLKYPAIEYHNIHLTFLYTLFYQQVVTCAGIVGLKEIYEKCVCMFDGVYFSMLMFSLRNDDRARARSLENIQHLRLYASIGTSHQIR